MGQTTSSAVDSGAAIAWLHMDPPRIEVTGTITATDARGYHYTLYRVHVTAGSNKWTVERRFSDFKRLAEQLRLRAADQGARASPHPALPSSLMSAPWTSGGNMNPDFVVRRAKGLQSFLRALVHALPLSDSLISAFLTKVPHCLNPNPTPCASQHPQSRSAPPQTPLPALHHTPGTQSFTPHDREPRPRSLPSARARVPLSGAWTLRGWCQLTRCLGKCSGRRR